MAQLVQLNLVSAIPLVGARQALTQIDPRLKSQRLELGNAWGAHHYVVALVFDELNRHFGATNLARQLRQRSD